MINEKFNGLIEYRGFKNIFIGLLDDQDNKYYIIFGKTGTPNLTIEEQYNNISWHWTTLYKYLENKTCNLNIPFISMKNNSLVNIIPIENKKEYENLIFMLEKICNE